MDQIVIKRSPNSIFESIVWIVICGGYLFEVTTKKNQLLWNLLGIYVFVLMVLYVIKLYIELKYPEIEIKNGKICFRQRRLRLKWYVCLPIDKIECVIELKRKFYTIYTFVMKDGQKFEYFPDGKSDERLNKVRTFMKNIADYPIHFKLRTEGEK